MPHGIWELVELPCCNLHPTGSHASLVLGDLSVRVCEESVSTNSESNKIGANPSGSDVRKFAEPHVLVVDDDRRLRALLHDFLSENGFLVATADNAADARDRIAYLDFDALVLDVMMPGEDGVQFLRDLRGKSDIPVLLLTAMDEIQDRIIGFEGGADDYLAKPFEPRELVLRLNAILRRSRASSIPHLNVIRFGEFVFDSERGELLNGTELIRLTSGEVALMRALSRRAGLPVSRDFLASNMNVGPRTVDVQIARLRRKIESNLRYPRYLITVRGEGYVLRVD